MCVRNRGVTGHLWQVVTQHRDFSVQSHLCVEFGHKYQVIFEHRDSKRQVLLHVIIIVQVYAAHIGYSFVP